MFQERFNQAIPINPSFPNWNKSFVSGHESPLFHVDHRVAQDPIELLSVVKFKAAAEGPPGHVHGGATAGLIDEVMGILAWNQNIPVVTQKLEVRYLRPLPLLSTAYLSTQIVHQDEKTVLLKTTLYCKQKTPCIEASGVFYRISEELMKKFKSASE
jgi:acyl-coenzyme A thioesterase PaaI-like protein